MVAEQESIATRDQARRLRRTRRSRSSTPTRPASCTAPTRCSAWMQETSDRAVAELGATALRHPRADPHASSA